MEKKPMKNQLSTIKEINSTNLSEADLRSLFSWPPRSYTCTFCKRDFRSAQALGGHMNVHRRDRARLRQAISNHHPRLNLNTDPNPSFASFNPSNPSFPASAKAHHQPLMKLPPPVSTISTTSPATLSDHLVKWGRADLAQDLMVKTKELMAERRLLELEKMSSMMHGNGSNYLAVDQRNPGEGIVNMELDFGLISEVKEDDHLDLELRLGYV